ncbi:D-arabinono-1,4-lactone oxidase [Glutamicibacter sp.]|uniref:D-arabinono-1,4-lactone oxidase n=1 Tax=Glutamicibacter sp. TaxID=1931995 RepID=UPI0028BDB47E|nr:D-arabinono-1,4-lactone oxidase [Glutamicibacter sp.]
MSTFSNFAGTVTSTPLVRRSIGSLDQLAESLDAAQLAGHSVRTIGAGHSFTALAQTDQVLLDLDGFAGIEEVDALSHEVTFRAGTRLWQIPALLKPFGLALENMGDIDKQSIAGAISTGTHGTGLKFTGFSGTVTGIQLMLADGSRVRTSKSENAQLFEAARLSLGALGVITHVRLRCVPAFMMHAVESIEPIESLTRSFIERAALEDHLEFFWFPGSPRAQVKINTRLPADTERNAPGPVARWVNDELLSNGALQALCSLGAAAPRLNDRLSRFASRVLSDRSYTAHWHEAFVSPRRVKFTEQEYALPLQHFQPAMEELRRYFSSAPSPVLFPIEVRTASADDVWLSTANGRDCVYIAVHRYIRDAAPKYFADIEALLRPLGGRPHWGKEHSLKAEDFAQLYPRFTEFRQLRSAVDPEGRFLNGYLRSLLGAG